MNEIEAAIVMEQALIALTALIFLEARGEPEMGQLAVAHVVLNRTQKPELYGDGVLGVITRPHQFTPMKYEYRAVARLQAMDPVAYHDCQNVARMALAGLTEDPTDDIGGATHFWAVWSTEPRWAKHAVATKRIGRHIFARLKQDNEST